MSCAVFCLIGFLWGIFSNHTSKGLAKPLSCVLGWPGLLHPPPAAVWGRGGGWAWALGAAVSPPEWAGSVLCFAWCIDPAPLSAENLPHQTLVYRCTNCPLPPKCSFLLINTMLVFSRDAPQSPCPVAFLVSCSSRARPGPQHLPHGPHHLQAHRSPRACFLTPSWHCISSCPSLPHGVMQGLERREEG